MGKAARLKRERKHASPLDPKLMEAWNRGFSAGAKSQREQDIEQVMKWLASLEEIPGIGEKRAWEIRRHFLDFFGGGNGMNLREIDRLVAEGFTEEQALEIVKARGSQLD